MNRWILDDIVRYTYKPVVEEFVDRAEKRKINQIDLSDTKLNPYTLEIILEEIGYEVYERDYNGWEMDFSITMTKEGFKSLEISGCGMTFELKLSICE